MMLVDSHCHLDFEQLRSQSGDVVDRAVAAGVGLMVTICTKIPEFPQVLAVARQYDNVYASVGTHPYYAHLEADITEDEILLLAQDEKVVAIGETGLDYFRNKAPKEAQEASFRKHIAVCRELQLPLVIHTRDAEEDTARILKEEMAIGAFPALLHCFIASKRLADQALEMGLYISLSGVLTFRNAEELRTTVRDVPLDRLLVETDAPYLAPVPHRGKDNEPALVVHTAEKLAEIKGGAPEEIARQTTANFFRLFGKVDASRAKVAA